MDQNIALLETLRSFTQIGDSYLLQNTLERIPFWDGNVSQLEYFLQDISAGLLSIKPEQESRYVAGIISKLQGAAKRSICDKTLNTVKDLSNHLKNRFAKHLTFSYYYQKLQHIRRSSYDTTGDFYDQINKLLNLSASALKDEIPANQHDQIDTMMVPIKHHAIDIFIIGLAPDIAWSVDAKRPRDLDEAYREAIRIESRVASGILPQFSEAYNYEKLGGNSFYSQDNQDYFSDQSDVNTDMVNCEYLSQYSHLIQSAQTLTTEKFETESSNSTKNLTTDSDIMSDFEKTKFKIIQNELSDGYFNIEYEKLRTENEVEFHFQHPTDTDIQHDIVELPKFNFLSEQEIENNTIEIQTKSGEYDYYSDEEEIDLEDAEMGLEHYTKTHDTQKSNSDLNYDNHQCLTSEEYDTTIWNFSENEIGIVVEPPENQYLSDDEDWDIDLEEMDYDNYTADHFLPQPSFETNHEMCKEDNDLIDTELHTIENIEVQHAPASLSEGKYSYTNKECIHESPISEEIQYQNKTCPKVATPL